MGETVPPMPQGRCRLHQGDLCVPQPNQNTSVLSHALVAIIPAASGQGLCHGPLPSPAAPGHGVLQAVGADGG